MHGAWPPLSQLPSWYAKVQHGSLLSMLLVWQHLDSHTCVRTFTNSSKYIDIVYGLYVQNVFGVLRNKLSRTSYVLFLKIWTSEPVPIQWPLAPYFQHVTRCPVIICVIINEVLKFFFWWSCVYTHKYIYRHNTII